MSVDREQGIASLKQGNLDDAIAALERAIQADPNDFLSATYLGAAYAQAERPADAVTSLTRAVEIQPSNPQARFNLGVALQKAGWNEQAITAYEQALTLQADYPQAVQALNALRPPTPQAPPTSAYTPPQSAYAPPPQQPYAPPAQGYGTENPYSAAPAPNYPVMNPNIDMDRARNGLKLYGYGGYALIVIIILTFVAGFSAMGEFMQTKQFPVWYVLLQYSSTIAQIAMLVGVILVFRATKIKQLAVAASLEIVSVALPFLFRLMMPAPANVTFQQATRAGGAVAPQVTPNMGVIAAAGGMGLLIGAMSLGALYFTLKGFQQLASELNDIYAQPLAEQSLSIFKAAAICFVISAVLLFLGLPGALLGGLGFLAGGICLLVAWVKSILTALALTNN